MNIWKIIYLNCRERYEFVIDRRSYTHNLSSCEIKAWKKFRPEQDSNPWTLRYQCSALSTELSSHWELVTLTSFLSWKSQGRQRQSQIYFLSVGGENPWVHFNSRGLQLLSATHFEQPGLSAPETLGSRLIGSSLALRNAWMYIASIVWCNIIKQFFQFYA